MPAWILLESVPCLVFLYRFVRKDLLPHSFTRVLLFCFFFLYSRRKRKHENQQDKDQPYVKKPPNAFMLFRKEQRPNVVAELSISDSAMINTILGQRVSVFLFFSWIQMIFIHCHVTRKQIKVWSEDTNALWDVHISTSVHVFLCSCLCVCTSCALVCVLTVCCRLSTVEVAVDRGEGQILWRGGQRKTAPLTAASQLVIQRQLRTYTLPTCSSYMLTSLSHWKESCFRQLTSG